MFPDKPRLARDPIARLLAIMLVLAWSVTVSANDTLVYNILTGTDDAEEGNDGPGIVDLASSDLEITTDDVAQFVGLRFTGIDIPQGMPILDAYIQLTTDEDDKDQDPFMVTIHAQANDNAATFSEANGDLSTRPLTEASVVWRNVPGWTLEHEAGPNQRTPNIAALVQEIVDRDGWQAGNAIAFLMEGVGTRSAESFEGSDDHVQLPDLAAHLVITVPSRAVYPIKSSVDDAEEGDDEPGKMDVESSDLELTEDHEGQFQTIGLRFASTMIPAGAQILSAHIQFAVDEIENAPGTLTIYGEANTNPASYADTPFNITSRAKTEESVVWADIPEWTTEGEAGPAQRTPDITPIVQTIVDDPDWAEGNAIAFIVEGNGLRNAESFDGDPSLAPALHVTYIGERQTASSDKIRLSWSDDPATTMTIIWDQSDDAEANLLYNEYTANEGCVTDPVAYRNAQPPNRITPYRGMNNHIAKLTGLTPATDYRFVISDGDKVSECGWFRTAPAQPQPFTFISGGDTKSSGDPLDAGRWANEMVAKLRPLFVFFTGDFNSGDGTSDARWQQWLTDWSTLTKSADGRMYPIIAVHGNHEDGDFEMLYHLFDSGNQDPAQSADYSYFALSVAGEMLRIYNLNSQFFLNGMTDAHALQLAWLAEDLAMNQGHTFKVAGYHKPIRPHTQSKAENDHELAWADLFDQYGLDIAFDSDTHNHAITFPLRRSDAQGNVMGFVRDDENGVLYVGEGSWGATPRLNNDDKAWTLDSASMNQIKWNHVYPAEGADPARWEIRTVVTAKYDDNGNLVNYVDGVGEVSEDNLFAIPEGITLHEVPFYGPVIELPFQAVSGDAPLAPFNLAAQADGYTTIHLTWTNSSATNDVKGIEIERSIGFDGEWLLAANSLPGDTVAFTETDLTNGTDYYYRVRAINVFGASPWSEPVLASTPVDERSRVTFQEAMNGYTGTDLVVIASAAPAVRFIGADRNDSLSIDLDTSDYGGPGQSHGLIRFADLFSANGIPSGAQIDGATLRFYTTSSTDGPVEIYQILKEWEPATVSWSHFLDGLQPDGIETKTTATDSKPNLNGGEFVTFEVSAAVQAWANGEPNYGLALLNTSTDGWDIQTEEYAGDEFERRRPLLTVFYTDGEPPVSGDRGDIDGNGVIDRADLDALRGYLYPNKPDTDCPACDLDGDDRITLRDLHTLMLMLQ